MATVQRKRPNIVSVFLSPEAKRDLDKACGDRGMTIKSLLGRLIGWFVTLDKTEQSVVLGQLEASDITSVAELVQRRRGGKGAAAVAAMKASTKRSARARGRR